MNTTTTTNGALQYRIDPVVEFFTQVGAKTPEEQIYSLFKKAVAANKDLAVRSLLWSYDCRGGAGRRANFLTILPHAVNAHLLTEEEAKAILTLIPELGRWDALCKLAESIKSKSIQSYALNMICEALLEGNSLCAKWMPRKGLMAARIMGYFSKVLEQPMNHKQYRQLLVKNTKVVETLMSANNWQGIDYEHVPSVAGSRYRNAFDRHDYERHQAYIKAVANGEAKMNTSALYPHDIARMIAGMVGRGVINTAWKSLQDIPVNGNILCMADVSGSMGCANVSGSITAMNVAITMAIYFAERAKGMWRNMIMTYSAVPELIALDEGDTFTAKYYKVEQGSPSPLSTDIQLAYRKILRLGVNNGIPKEDMPSALVILSDMQFDGIGPKSIDDDIKASFIAAGYDIPKLIYWNLNSYCNGVPISSVLSKDSVEYSGYSPRGIETVLGDRTMVDVLLETVNIDRYKWLLG